MGTSPSLSQMWQNQLREHELPHKFLGSLPNLFRNYLLAEVVLWPTPLAVLGQTLLGKLRLTYTRPLHTAAGLRKGLLHRGLSWTYLVLIGLGPGDHGSEGHARHWAFSCSNNDSSPNGARFRYMFAAIHHPAKDLPKNRTSEEEERE